VRDYADRRRDFRMASHPSHLSHTIAIVVVLVGSCACGGHSSPTNPSDPSITLTGHVTATNGGQPLGGLVVDLGTQTTGTDMSGGFALSNLAGGSRRLSLTGSTIVPRSLLIAVESREVAVDAISLNGFDLSFYRQFVRNGLDAAGALEPLRRWTTNPNLYLKTVDEAGAPIPGPTLDMVETAARAIVPVWTSQRFTVATVERGTGTRVGTAGWITIRWPAIVVNANQCGRAPVSGGYVELEAHNPRCQVWPWITSPSLVRHELGHAMGYWHTNAPTDVMSGTNWITNDQQPSARERAHAAIAYARPVGNTDPDTDPAGIVTLAPSRIVQ
jgi:hypothetical protein